MALVDNNVLSALAKIDRLQLLDAVFDEVATTTSVSDELHRDAVSGYPFVDRIDDVKQPDEGWLRVVAPTESEIQRTEEILDPSLSYTDAELIAIAAGRTERLLTDDRHAGTIATAQGVDTWDLPLFLRAACERETIETQSELEEVLADLRQRDYYEFSTADEHYLLDYFRADTGEE